MTPAAASARRAVPRGTRVAVGGEHPIEIYDVNRDMDFVVFSLSDAEKFSKGARLVLVNRDTPVATVELIELDNAGFAVAQLLNTEGAKPLVRKGDRPIARPILSATP
jgi:hypothetical protein